MQLMFVSLIFSQTVAKKLLEEKGTDFPDTLANLSGDDITSICNVILRSGGLVTRRIPDKGNETS